MSTKRKNRKILSREIAMYFSKEFVYREQLLVWILADILKIVGLCFVWYASSKISGSVSQGYVVTYYILLMLVSKLTSDYTLEFGIRDVIQGRFSNFLIKPFNYLLEYLGTNIGGNILRFFLFIPGFVLAIYLAEKYGLWIVRFNPEDIFFGILAVLVGFLMSFLLGNIMSLLSIFLKEMDGIRIFYYNISSLLSGEFVPIVFLPMVGQYVLYVLPFRYTLSFPVEILIGSTNEYERSSGFLVAVGWLIILWFLYKVVYKLAIRKYEAEGI